jgi:hypothetical protein
MVKIGNICDRFCNIKAFRHKKMKKEGCKTSLLKFSKTSCIVTAFRRHNTESQLVTIVIRHNAVLEQHGKTC